MSDEQPSAGGPHGSDDPGPADVQVEQRDPRPIIERLGLGAVALVLAILFGGVAAASWIGGEPFLAVMAGIGCLMTIWVGGITIVRG